MKNFAYRVCQPVEYETVTDVYFANKEELCLPDRAAAEQVTRLLFSNGYVVGGYHGTNLVGALGYFLGEPQHHYANNEILYLYVGAILPAYRLTRLFHDGLLFTLQLYQGTAVTHLKLQADAANPYTNKLYGRFAQPIARGKSPRGVPVITYSGSIEDAIAYLTRRQRQLVHELLTAVR